MRVVYVDVWRRRGADAMTEERTHLDDSERVPVIMHRAHMAGRPYFKHIWNPRGVDLQARHQV